MTFILISTHQTASKDVTNNQIQSRTCAMTKKLVSTDFSTVKKVVGFLFYTDNKINVYAKKQYIQIFYNSVELVAFFDKFIRIFT